jgi:hypothetical protein
VDLVAHELGFALAEHAVEEAVVVYWQQVFGDVDGAEGDVRVASAAVVRKGK